MSCHRIDNPWLLDGTSAGWMIKGIFLPSGARQSGHFYAQNGRSTPKPTAQKHPVGIRSAILYTLT